MPEFNFYGGVKQGLNLCCCCLYGHAKCLITFVEKTELASILHRVIFIINPGSIYGLSLCVHWSVSRSLNPQSFLLFLWKNNSMCYISSVCLPSYNFILEFKPGLVPFLCCRGLLDKTLVWITSRKSSVSMPWIELTSLLPFLITFPSLCLLPQLVPLPPSCLS